MSVVIKMDMPKSCRECAEKCGLINHCAAFISEDWGKHDVSCERAADCPILCELPEKHGRLIDADGLFEFINDHSYPVRYDRNSIEKGMNITGIKECIDEAPTIIEAEGEHDGK